MYGQKKTYRYTVKGIDKLREKDRSRFRQEKKRQTDIQTGKGTKRS